MNTEEFDRVKNVLIGEANKIVLNLQRRMLAFDKEDILSNNKVIEHLLEHVEAAHNGLKKVAHVMEFFDAWEKIGDIPSIDLVDGGNDDGTAEPGGSEGISGETDSELL